MPRPPHCIATLLIPANTPRLLCPPLQVKLRFGSSRQPRAMLWMSSMLDLYHGGAAHVGLLGMAQVDRWGNVNASNFAPGRNPGCGGFIDISQSVGKLVFVGTFTSGGLQVGGWGGCTGSAGGREPV